MIVIPRTTLSRHNSYFSFYPLDALNIFGMPKRTIFKKLVVIGSGPIIIGQAVFV